MPLSPSVLPPRHPLRTAINALLASSAVGAALVIFGAAWAEPDYRVAPANIAASTAKKYALEAYAQWSTRTDRSCPDNLWTLNQYMNNRSIEDPWGTEYAMHCGTRAPSGRPGILIVSAGEDERFGTDDDIRSDD
jgi:hypothetical protein